jgi:hypothetical protein
MQLSQQSNVDHDHNPAWVHDPGKLSYQFNLSFEVQRQYAKAKPRVKSIKDAKESIKAVTHCNRALNESKLNILDPKLVLTVGEWPNQR